MKSFISLHLISEALPLLRSHYILHVHNQSFNALSFTLRALITRSWLHLRYPMAFSPCGVLSCRWPHQAISPTCSLADFALPSEVSVIHGSSLCWIFCSAPFFCPVGKTPRAGRVRSPSFLLQGAQLLLVLCSPRCTSESTFLKILWWDLYWNWTG